MSLDPVLLEGVSLGLRGLHVLAAVVWIGTSFYVAHLDASLRNPGGLPAGVRGEAWQVHGGGFYRVQKYAVAPPGLPDRLTWFKWEAYTAWLSGFALLVALYYGNAELYLIDPAVMDLTPAQAVSLGLVSLVVGYGLYEALCRSPLGRDDRKLAAAGLVLLAAAGWGYTQVFSGRGAYIHLGALVGTIMVASIAHVVIPNQRKIAADLAAGRAPDPKLEMPARQRSRHNDYLTLPVLFVMISNHYPLTYASRWNGLILAVFVVVGFAIRHFYNVRRQGLPSPWWTWGVAAAGTAVVILLAGWRAGADEVAGGARIG